ncbi:hypothetical protein T210_0134995 [Burkholderia pseudomallei MSHR6137]|nr:hypothetical protein T210_0134995 [Burkholderia pseudomallei MSHR6137]
MSRWRCAARRPAARAHAPAGLAASPSRVVREPGGRASKNRHRLGRGRHWEKGRDGRWGGGGKRWKRRWCADGGTVSVIVTISDQRLAVSG